MEETGKTRSVSFCFISEPMPVSAIIHVFVLSSPERASMKTTPLLRQIEAASKMEEKRFLVALCGLTFAFLASIQLSSADLAQLDGLQAFSFDLTAGRRCDRLQLSFRTVAASGLLVACSGTANDSVRVELLEGRLW